MAAWIKLVRVHQWVKNLFLFFPAFFGAQFFDPELLVRLGLGFISYSFVASGIYILNDLVDIEKDREHPEKCDRPLASGVIGKAAGMSGMGVCLGIGFALAGYLSLQFLMVVGLYFVLNLAYSFKLKQLALVDITIISIGFVLRIFAGGVLAGIYVSHWLILMTFLLAMMMALAKRRDDLLILESSGKEMRKSLHGYNIQFVDSAMVLMSSATLVSYILYSVSPDVVERIGSPYVYLTSLFVVLGILRYIQLALVENKSGSPTQILLKDVFIQVVFLGWIATFAILLYA